MGHPAFQGRFDFDPMFHIDCFGVTPQTYMLLKRGDRDLSIAGIREARSCCPRRNHMLQMK